MKKLMFYFGSLAILVLGFVSCNSGGSQSKNSVIVLCQGASRGAGSLTQYNTATKVSSLDFYKKANNGTTIGDTPMSMSVLGQFCWVPTTGGVTTFDPANGRYMSRVPNLAHPSFVGFLSNMVYISETFEPRIYAYNLKSGRMVDTIHLSSAANRVISIDNYMYTNLWSYGKQIVKFSPFEYNKLVDSVEVGIQPNTLVVDQHRNLWTITDGGYAGNPLGDVSPEIVVVSTSDKLKVTKRFPLVDGPNYQLSMSVWGTKVYYTAGSRVFAMPVDATALPTTPVIEAQGANFSAVAEDPFTGDIYVADAGDWMSNGKVYRYSKDYSLIDSFATGPNPIAFCFVQ